VKYRKLEDGEVRTIPVVTPGVIDHKIACCDCGLVHRVRLNVNAKRDYVEFMAWRDKRATAAKRRARARRLSGSGSALKRS
jgi:hypothetical protein